jgi:DNA-binding SARP family transcriptional activator/TolB-like protein/Tfp pilus assembly protein PilF
MIRLKTLGGVDLRDAGGREVRRLLAQPKRVALLVYLALADATGYRRRDKVVALFWPDLDEEHARGSLRQALSFLRKTLGDGVVITRGEDEIGVDRSRIECDSGVITDASDEEVMARYQGHFLDGFHVSDVDPEFQSWIEAERVRLRRRAATAAWTLAEQRRASGSPREAAAFARQAAALTPDDESETRRLITWLDELGDRSGAMAAYDELASRLERDFEARPSPETQALIGRVRTRTQPGSGASAEADLEKTLTTPLSSVPSADTATSRRRGPRQLVAAGAIIALAVVVLVVRDLIGSRPSTTATSPKRLTVAVLPLRDLSPDTMRRYVADGVTDELITNLAQGNDLRVIGSRTMLAYRDSSLSPDVIGRRLDADAFVSGSLQYIGDTVHMTIQLSRAGENGTLFGRSFSGTRGELLRMQRDIARTLVRQIAGGRVPTETAFQADRPGNSEAVELYIRGRYYWNKRGGSNLLRATDLFRQALDADPLFALAHSGMADAYVQLGYASLLAPSDAFLKAEASARNALAIDSTLAEPHATLGFVNLYYKWDWKTAEDEFKKSIALNPSYATAYEWYGLFLAAMGRFDDAIRNEERAKELDPLSAPIAGTAAWVKHYAGRHGDARQEIGVALRMDSTYALGHLYLGRIFQAQGHLDSALAQYAATGPLRSWVPTVSSEGYVHAQLRHRVEAEAALALMDSMSHTSYVTSYAVAIVHAALGRRDIAFNVLDQAKRERTHWLVWLNRDPRWAPLRGDTRFATLSRSMGLPP